MSPPRGSAMPPVSLLWSPAAPLVFPVCVLVRPAASSAPAPVVRAVKPLFYRMSHCQCRCCQSCQVRRSTARPAVLFPPSSVPRRTSTSPLLRFPLPEPVLRYLLARVREHAVYLHYIAHVRRHREHHPLTRVLSHNYAGSPLARRPYYHRLSHFLLTPTAPLDSSSVSHLCRAPTGSSSLFSSPQPFLLPKPVPRKT